MFYRRTHPNSRPILAVAGRTHTSALLIRVSLLLTFHPLHQLNNAKEGFNNRIPIKHRKRKPYAAPTYDRMVLGNIACAAAYFERAGCYGDANAFKEFCSDAFDTSKVEEAFAVRYKLSKGSTREEDYKAAVALLRNAAVRLREQNLKYGEDTWNLLMEQVRGMIARERERKEISEKTLDEMDDALAKIRNGDQAMIQAVLEMAMEFEEEDASHEDE